MKKYTLMLMVLLYSVHTYAVPAYPYAEKISQPDGTELTIRMHGDEYLNWTTTSDGYTVVRDSKGYYVYAEENNGALIATDIIARDLESRSNTEKSYLNKVKKNLIPQPTPANAELRNTNRIMSQANITNAPLKAWNYEKFKGLVILVEYNDQSFSRSDTPDLFNDMMNKENFDGYLSNTIIQSKISCTGSVRDYFYDNSNQKFSPQFTVVGPVKINYSQYYIEQTTYRQTIMKAACTAADPYVNFADFDTDGDNVVDMVYFVFAGGGSNFSGNDTRLLWPHASSLSGTFDGVRMGRYACSTELYGAPASKVIDGIGTICHEFSHVLGLMDEYDTDYTGSGGQSVHPGYWSLMASGSYLNYSRTPAGYSLFERYQSGFSTPTLITEAGDYTIDAIDKSNEGYRINSAINKEYFLIENRQKNKWNAYLPGHGMLVFRVDSTNVGAWSSNSINANPLHNYYELLRANPKKQGTSTIDSGGDPFPGTGNIISLTNETTPSIQSWAKVSTPIIINNISESSDGKISFSASMDKIESDVEDFEAFDATETDVYGVAGKFCNWDIEGAVIASPDAAWCNGKKAVATLKKGQITTSKLKRNVTQLSFNLYNPTNSTAVFRCYYSVNDGSTWVVAKSIEGLDNYTISANGTATPIYNVLLTEPAMFRIAEYTGHATSYCYIDDINFKYDKNSSIEQVTKTTADNKFSAWCDGDEVVVSGVSEGVNVKIYNIGGSVEGSAKVENGEARIKLNNRGFYIVSDGLNSVKLVY